MTYQQEALEKTESALSRMREVLAAEHQGYLGVGLYTQSKPGGDKIVMATHGETDPDDLMRVDRHVLYRELSPENSIAATAYFSDEPIDGPSYMFPDQHYCIHTRIRDSRGRIWLIQHVFDRHASQPERSVLDAHFYDISHTKSLINLLDHLEIDGARLKGSYAQNALIVYCDINNSKQLAETHGYNRFEDFCRAFRHSFLDPRARQHGGYAVKYEGDGLSICFPFEDKSTQRKKTKAAIQFIQAVQSGLQTFAAAQDYKLRDCTVKIAADIGEIFTYHLPRADRDPAQTPIRIDHAGDVFITVRQALEEASRKNNSVSLGRALTAYLADHPHLSRNFTTRAYKK